MKRIVSVLIAIVFIGHAKPIVATIMADNSSKSLAAIERCMVCHTDNPRRQFQLPQNPLAALEVFRSQFRDPTVAHVNPFIFWTMARESRFSNLSNADFLALVNAVVDTPVETMSEAIEQLINPLQLREMPQLRTNAASLLAKIPETTNPIVDAILKNAFVYTNHNDIRRSYQDGGRGSPFPEGGLARICCR